MTRASAKAPACPSILAIVALLVAAAGAAAAPEEQYLIEYRAYSAAMADGDGTVAATHARAAWQSAEAELGAHRLTAILAYNYGRLIALTDAETALVPLLRARALHDAGFADLPPEQVRLYSAYAEFEADGRKRREANDLREILQAMGADAAAADPDLASMWLRLTTYDVVEERYRTARESAASAEAAMLSAGIDNPHYLASAIMLGGIARLVPYPRKVEDVQAAHNEFSRARRLFPPQKDLESFDPLLAKVLAWDHAADSALATLDYEDYPDHADAVAEESPPTPPLFEPAAFLDCEAFEWANQDAPRFPPLALRDGRIGAVFIGFRLADDFTVKDARILAEVPMDEFGEYALDAVKQWRAKPLPSEDPACYQNLVISIQFVIDD
jgi:TonB family protein